MNFDWKVEISRCCIVSRYQANDVHFLCRIKGNTQKTCIKELPFDTGGIIFYDAVVRLGQPSINETKMELRLVGYKFGNKNIGLQPTGLICQLNRSC